MRTHLAIAGCLGLIMWGMAAHSQHLAWAKQIGSSAGSDRGYSITVDASGNVYATGVFGGTVDFDPGIGTFNLTSAGAGDVFVTKLDISGNLTWAKQFGGIDNSYGYSIAVDSMGNVYTTGYFIGPTDFNPGPGTFNLTPVSVKDVFIAKLDPSGNLSWAKQLAGSGNDIGYSIGIDAAGNVYVTGFFSGTMDFNPGPGTFNLTPTGLIDFFITKLDASGNLIWAKKLGGTSYEEANSIAVDAAGNVYATGYFQGTADFDPGAGTFNLTPAGQDVFIVHLDASGNFRWAKQIGGAAGDGYSIAVDAAGNVYATGYFQGTSDFDPGVGTFNLTSTGGYDVFTTKLDSAGNLIWAKQFGGTGSDNGRSIAVDAAGNVYTTGYFQGTSDFDPGAGTFNLTSAGDDDVFAAKVDSAGNLSCAKQFGGTGTEIGFSITVDTAENLYATGYFQHTSDFDPGPDTFNLTSTGYDDIFLLKLDAVTTVTLSGTILTETGIPVPGIKVMLDGGKTDSVTTFVDGRYSFEVEQCGSYTITPSKSNDSIPNNGITQIDALLMRRHLLGIAPLSSPYKIIAAAEVSADGDTAISAQDILLTRSLILGNITSFPTNRLWQFVSSDYVFPDNTHPFPFPKTRTYTNIIANQTNQDFIGIKLGDVNGSWDPNTP